MNIEVFDLMVLYDENEAHSASHKRYRENLPFPLQSHLNTNNTSYAYFLCKCKKNGLKAAFTTTADIIKPGLFKSYWKFNKKWIRINKKAVSRVLFEKFLPRTQKMKKKRDQLVRNKKVFLFHNEELVRIFTDKLATYKAFKKFCIPTVEIENFSKNKIQKAKKCLDAHLKKHKNKTDFGPSYILKDRFGYGGENVFRIFTDKDFGKVLAKQKKWKNMGVEHFVLQPFVNFKNGFSFDSNPTFMDLRVIVFNQQIVQVATRIAKKRDFRCNLRYGAKIKYLKPNQIPKTVRKITSQIIQKTKAKHALFSLDFIQSNAGNVYLLEGNNNLGIDWDPNNKEDMKFAKQLIRLVVQEIKRRVKTINN